MATLPARRSLLSRLGGAMRAAMDAFAPIGTPAQSHQAATVGRRLGNWRPSAAGPNTVVAADAPQLVNRSRDLARNNPHARHALSLIGTHTVGTGMKPRSLCSNQVVKDALHELWDAWTDQADADGVLDFYGMQALAVREMAEGGEAFGRLRTRRLSDGLPVPLQVQLIPVEQVPLWYTNASPGGNLIVQGIERNGIGQRVAYWMHRQNPNDALQSLVANAWDVAPVAAADICHLYNVARIGQLRGLPWLAAAITALQQIGQYQDAELVRKQTVAMLVGFVTKGTPEGMTAEDLAESWGEIRQDLGDLPAAALEPGTMQYLDFNEDVKFTQPAEVGGSYEAFLRANYQAVAVAADLIYEELTGDWSKTNDRTFRVAFNTFKRSVRQWQHHLVAFQFNRPIWNRFVDLAVASGAVKQPKSVSDIDLKRVDWVPERWEYINPVQDVQSIREELDGGLTSRSAVVASRGDDVEAVDRQIAADQKRERDLKIVINADMPRPPAGVAPKGDQADPTVSPETGPADPAEEGKS